MCQEHIELAYSWLEVLLNELTYCNLRLKILCYHEMKAPVSRILLTDAVELGTVL